MKIDIYTDSYEPEVNGVVTQVVSLRKQLLLRGHKVKTFAPNVPGFKDKDKNVYRLLSLRVMKNIEQRLALPSKSLVSTFWQKADVVHAHSPGPVGAFGLVHARLYRMPYIFTYHTDLSEYTHYLLDGKLLRPRHAKSFSKFYCNLADVVIAPSEKIKKMLLEWGVTKPIKVVSNGVDLSKFPGKENYLVKNNFVKKQDQVLLFVGRIAKEKNIEFLINVFPKIRAKNPKAKLVIAGTGPHKAYLEKMARGNRGIVFTGLVEPDFVGDVYAGGDIFLFSSSTEIHPLCVVEALASGLPVVGLDDEALNNMVFDGKNGFRVENESKFVDAVCRLLANDKLRLDFGHKSRSIAVGRFSANASLKKHLEVYREAILSRNGKDIITKIGSGALGLRKNRFVFKSVVAALVAVMVLTVAFYGPTDIKAAPGKVISKVNPKVFATSSVRKIRTGVDRIEDKIGKARD